MIIETCMCAKIRHAKIRHTPLHVKVYANTYVVPIGFISLLGNKALNINLSSASELCFMAVFAHFLHFVLGLPYLAYRLSLATHILMFQIVRSNISSNVFRL